MNRWLFFPFASSVGFLVGYWFRYWSFREDEKLRMDEWRRRTRELIDFLNENKTL